MPFVQVPVPPDSPIVRAMVLPTLRKLVLTLGIQKPVVKMMQIGSQKPCEVILFVHVTLWASLAKIFKTEDCQSIAIE